MNSMSKMTCIFLAAGMLMAPSLAQANERKAPVPTKVLAAKTIFVDNQTNDAELQHDAYMGLSKWGRFEIVDSPQKADLVLRLSGSSVVKFVPGGQATSTYTPMPVSETSAAGEYLAPPGCTRLTLMEAKSGSTLWSDVRKTSNSQEKSKLLEGLHDAVDQQEKRNSK
jgi:hypothetical protein